MPAGAGSQHRPVEDMSRWKAHTEQEEGPLLTVLRPCIQLHLKQILDLFPSPTPTPPPFVNCQSLF